MDGIFYGFLLIVTYFCGIAFGRITVETNVTPKLFESATYLCDKNEGLKYLSVSGDTECINGAKFEIDQK